MVRALLVSISDVHVDMSHGTRPFFEKSFSEVDPVEVTALLRREAGGEVPIVALNLEDRRKLRRRGLRLLGARTYELDVATTSACR
jgi:hypothetical protein